MVFKDAGRKSTRQAWAIKGSVALQYCRENYESKWYFRNRVKTTL